MAIGALMGSLNVLLPILQLLNLGSLSKPANMSPDEWTHHVLTRIDNRHAAIMTLARTLIDLDVTQSEGERNRVHQAIMSGMRLRHRRDTLQKMPTFTPRNTHFFLFCQINVDSRSIYSLPKHFSVFK